MDARMQGSGMKRRNFFTSLAAGAAGLFAGVAVLRSLIRPAPPAGHGAIKVTINPLAVPRAKKEETSHG
jgi:hypothetical protein